MDAVWREAEGWVGMVEYIWALVASLRRGLRALWRPELGPALEPPPASSAPPKPPLPACSPSQHLPQPSSCSPPYGPTITCVRNWKKIEKDKITLDPEPTNPLNQPQILRFFTERKMMNPDQGIKKHLHSAKPYTPQYRFARWGICDMSNFSDVGVLDGSALPLHQRNITWRAATPICINIVTNCSNSEYWYFHVWNLPFELSPKLSISLISIGELDRRAAVPRSSQVAIETSRCTKN